MKTEGKIFHLFMLVVLYSFIPLYSVQTSKRIFSVCFGCCCYYFSSSLAFRQYKLEPLPHFLKMEECFLNTKII